MTEDRSILMVYGFSAGEVFKIAIEMEENGRAFYERAKERVDSPDLRRLFGSLAQEEMDHKKRFEHLLSELPPSATEATVWDPHNEIERYLKMMADIHIFRTGREMDKQLTNIKGTVDALNLAIQFEKDSIIFFLAMQDATEEKRGRELIGQLIREEQEHLGKLSLKLIELKRSS